MAWKKRTGLVTAHLLAGSLRKILQKYEDYYVEILTPDQRAKVLGLIQCCIEFLQDVPSHEPEA